MPTKKTDQTTDAKEPKKRATRTRAVRDEDVGEREEVIETPKKRASRAKKNVEHEPIEREYHEVVDREYVEREFVEAREYVDRDDEYVVRDEHEMQREVVEREFVDRDDVVEKPKKRASRAKKAVVEPEVHEAPVRREAAEAEPAQPVAAEPAQPVVAEPARPVVAEPAQPVVAEAAQPVVAAQPVAAEAETAATSTSYAQMNRSTFMNLFGFDAVPVKPVQPIGHVLSEEEMARNREEAIREAQAAAEAAAAKVAANKAKSPFVPRKLGDEKLVTKLIWPDRPTVMPVAYYPHVPGDLYERPPLVIPVAETYRYAVALQMQKSMQRKGNLPSHDIDCAPIVLANISRLNRDYFKRENLLNDPEGITLARWKKLVQVLQSLPDLAIGNALLTEAPLDDIVNQKPLGQVVIDTPTEGASDPIVVDDDPIAFLNYFSKPVEPYAYERLDDPNQPMQYVHTVNHCKRILDLIKTWSTKLPLIDHGFARPEDQRPLSMLFYDRFVKCLEVDNATAEQYGILLPDERLKRKYNLDDVDMFILWLVASLQIDPEVREYLIPVWTLGNIVVMSAAIVMRFVASNQMERSEILFRMSPSAPLQTNDLIRVALTRGPTMPLYFECMVPEQISLQFAGTTSLSTSSSAYASLEYPELDAHTFVAPEHEKAFDIVRNFITRPILNANPLLRRENLNFIPSLPFLIEGLAGSGRTTLMKTIASRLSCPIIIVNCSPLIMLAPDDFRAYFQDLFQDAELLSALVCLQNSSTILAENRYTAILTEQLARHAIVCAFCVDLAQTISAELDPFVTFKLKMTANLKENAVSYWQPHLQLPFADNSHVDMLDLSRKLALQPFQIQKAARLAYYATPDVEDQSAPFGRDISLSNEILTRSASQQISKNIGNLAFISDPEVSLDDVIVSDDIMAKIKQIIGSAQNRRRVLYEWGLSKRIKRGTGVICLFDGEPGTGKTHSAEAIARCLGLSLMRVNIASMVDKYIGETEKNLTKIFEQARPDMSLLLFDEADSLFTKRTSSVDKSNDRYSNMSVNVLLQLVERYEGVSILTTNLKKSIDPAFERRITYKIYFAMPKKDERKRLWEYMCPPDVLTSEPLDYDWLSELEMSGGEIKNAVLAGAFRAATLGKLLDTETLYDAGVSEAAAAGRVMRHYDDNFDGFE